MGKRWEGLLGCATAPMDDTISKLFLSLSLREMTLGAGVADQKAEAVIAKLEADCFPFAVLKKRLEVFKAHLSPTLDIGEAPQVFCGLISRTPGAAVMWAYTLNELFVKRGKRVTMAVLTDAFPMGFPTEAALDARWDSQKCKPTEGGTDNRVDDFSEWALPATKPA